MPSARQRLRDLSQRVEVVFSNPPFDQNVVRLVVDYSKCNNSHFKIEVLSDWRNERLIGVQAFAGPEIVTYCARKRRILRSVVEHLHLLLTYSAEEFI